MLFRLGASMCCLVAYKHFKSVFGGLMFVSESHKYIQVIPLLPAIIRLALFWRDVPSCHVEIRDVYQDGVSYM